MDIALNDANLEHYPAKSAAGSPLKGLLQARMALHGHGRSLHELAASADGIVSAVISHGVAHTSLVELSGLDLGAIKLLLEHPAPETTIKYAVSSHTQRSGSSPAAAPLRPRPRSRSASS